MKEDKMIFKQICHKIAINHTFFNLYHIYCIYKNRVQDVKKNTFGHPKTRLFIYVNVRWH